MALTKATYKAIANVYNGGTWNHPYSTARLSSDPRAGLVAFLIGAQKGMCAFCGMADSQLELCHLYPGGPKRLGWTPANIALGCRECNEIDGDSVIAYETIKRPDLIAVDWPSTPILADIGRKEKEMREMNRETKRRIRGM